MVYDNPPDNSYSLPQGPGNKQPHGAPTQLPPQVSPNTPSGSGQLPTFTSTPPSGFPASSVPKEVRRPDLRRFARKERGDLTSRLEALQALRKQVDTQSLRPRTVKPVVRRGNSGRTLTGTNSVINWYHSLNKDTKIGLACICLLVVLVLGISIFALAGGFQ
jgi:hypothetical protein